VNQQEVMESTDALDVPDAEMLLRMYRTMLLSRALDIRMFALNRQGRVPFVVPCQGHEGAQVGMVTALRPGRDFFLLYYRDLTAALAIGVTARDVMLGVFSRAADPASGGRQMPEHFSDRRLRIFTGSSSVGTHIPHASGVALASKRARRGRRHRGQLRGRARPAKATSTKVSTLPRYTACRPSSSARTTAMPSRSASTGRC